MDTDAQGYMAKKSRTNATASFADHPRSRKNFAELTKTLQQAVKLGAFGACNAPASALNRP